MEGGRAESDDCIIGGWPVVGAKKKKVNFHKNLTCWKSRFLGPPTPSWNILKLPLCPKKVCLSSATSSLWGKVWSAERTPFDLYSPSRVTHRQTCLCLLDGLRCLASNHWSNVRDLLWDPGSCSFGREHLCLWGLLGRWLSDQDPVSRDTLKRRKQVLGKSIYYWEKGSIQFSS